MAQADIAEKNFITLNDVFADIFNALVFGGETDDDVGCVK